MNRLGERRIRLGGGKESASVPFDPGLERGPGLVERLETQRFGESAENSQGLGVEQTLGNREKVPARPNLLAIHAELSLRLGAECNQGELAAVGKAESQPGIWAAEPGFAMGGALDLDLSGRPP